jgi:hypothetical protein
MKIFTKIIHYPKITNICKILVVTIFFVSLAVFLNGRIFNGWLSKFRQIYFVSHNESVTIPVGEAQAFDSVQSLALAPKATSKKIIKKSATPAKTSKTSPTQKVIPKKSAAPAKSVKTSPTKTAKPLPTKKPVPKTTAKTCPTQKVIPKKSAAPAKSVKTSPTKTAKPLPTKKPVPKTTAKTCPTQKVVPKKSIAPAKQVSKNNTPLALVTSTPITATSTTSITTSTTTTAATIGSVLSSNGLNDADPPFPPTLFEIRGTTDTAQFSPVAEGLAEANSNIDIYRSSDCSGQILGSDKTNPQGIFKVSITPTSEETTIYAKATDMAGNVSKCSETGLVFAATHLECPSVPADLPITRPPIDVAWEGYNYFLIYKTNPAVFTARQDELKAYPPKILGPGGFSGQVPFQWGGMGVVQGYTNSLYGDWTENSIALVGPQGPLPASQLQQRLDGIKDYLNQYKGITKYFPYIDFGTQMAGSHVSRIGFWEFYDKWDEYKALFDIGDKPPDPTTWLRRLSSSTLKKSASYPDELAGLSFSYDPTKALPYYRYSVNILSQGWEMWWKQVMQWLAKVGYEMTFVDNLYFSSCWNEECHMGYREWLAARFTPAEIDKYFTLRQHAPGVGSYWDWDFEGPDWYADTDNGSYRQGYAYANSGTLWPDEDSYHGLYSARLEGPGILTTATNFFPASGTYRLTIHYKTSPDAQASVLVDAAALPNEPVLFPLTSSSNWTEYKQQITFPATSYRLRFKLDGPGKLWVDDIWVEPVVIVNAQSSTEYPKFISKLPGTAYSADVGAELMSGSSPLAKLTTWAVSTFWDSAVDTKISYLRDMARQINPKFEIFTNSYRPRGKADYFMIEAQAHEFEATRDDVGNSPGVYKAGEHVRSGAAASDILSTNIFDFRYVHSKRAPDFFSYAMHLPVGNITHNLDSMLLHLAEVSAFGGGAGRDPGIRQVYWTYTEEVRKPYYELNKKFFAFVDNNTDLFACLVPSAEVGIVFHDVATKSDQGEVLDLATALAGRGITYDILTEERISKKNFDRFKVLIYHDVGKISDNEASLLLDFMTQGGAVIAVGDIGKYDSLYHLRAFNSNSVWPPVKFGGAQVVQQPVGSGKYIYVPAGSTNITDVTSWITDRLGRSPGMFPALSGDALARMRAAVWAGQKRIVVHLVNYNVPLGLNNANQVTALENLEVKIKLPDNFRPSKINIYSPEATSTVAASFKENSDGTVSFTVPKMRIYSIAEIK